MQDFRMETFLTVCEELNYTRAAHKLGLTQPAVSQHIHFLEESYGTHLFTIQGRKLYLTEAGKLLHASAQTMKNDESHLRRRLRNAQQPKKEYHFGATLTVAEYILPEKITKILSDDKGCRMKITVQNTRELLRQIDTGVIDFAVVEGSFPKEEYDFLPYSKEPYIAVCAADFPLPKCPCVLEDLLPDTLITREKGSGSRDILESILAQQNLRLADFARVVEYGSIGAIKRLTASGCGITFLYKKAAEHELRSRKLKEIKLQEFHLLHGLNFVFRKDTIFREEYAQLYSLLK